VLAAGLAGCIPITTSSVTGPEERLERAVRPSGAPDVALLPHPDQLGWTVVVTQVHEHELAITRTVEERRTHYFLNPLVAPVGLIGCAAGGWALALSLLAPHLLSADLPTLTQNACMQAIMVDRSATKLTRTRQVEHTAFTKENRPLPGVSLTLTWTRDPRIAVHYTTDTEGRAIVRLSHLITVLQHTHGSFATALPPDAVDLTVSHEGHTLARWQPILPAGAIEAARHTAPGMAPAERWPVDLIATLEIDGHATERRMVDARLTRALLAQGIRVVAPADTLATLQRELERSLNGSVEETGAVGPGHWLGPTLVIVAHLYQDATRTDVSVKVVNLRTREVVARIEVPAGPHDLAVALDVAVSQTAEVLRARAPR
jgi:hypothetical protein